MHRNFFLILMLISSLAFGAETSQKLPHKFRVKKQNRTTSTTTRCSEQQFTVISSYGTQKLYGHGPGTLGRRYSESYVGFGKSGKLKGKHSSDVTEFNALINIHTQEKGIVHNSLVTSHNKKYFAFIKKTPDNSLLEVMLADETGEVRRCSIYQSKNIKEIYFSKDDTEIIVKFKNNKKNKKIHIIEPSAAILIDAKAEKMGVHIRRQILSNTKQFIVTRDCSEDGTRSVNLWSWNGILLMADLYKAEKFKSIKFNDDDSELIITTRKNKEKSVCVSAIKTEKSIKLPRGHVIKLKILSHVVAEKSINEWFDKRDVSTTIKSYVVSDDKRYIATLEPNDAVRIWHFSHDSWVPTNRNPTSHKNKIINNISSISESSDGKGFDIIFSDSDGKNKKLPVLWVSEKNTEKWSMACDYY